MRSCARWEHRSHEMTDSSWKPFYGPGGQARRLVVKVGSSTLSATLGDQPYLDAFVAVVQAFLKIPSLHALAPAGSEPPFAIAQGVLFLIFVALGIAAARKFRQPALGAAG